MIFFPISYIFIAVQGSSKNIKASKQRSLICFYFCYFLLKYFLLMYLRKKCIKFRATCWTNFIFCFISFLRTVSWFYVREYTFCLFYMYILFFCLLLLFVYLQTCCLFILGNESHVLFPSFYFNLQIDVNVVNC